MTAPSEPVRPADEETVQALAQAAADAYHGWLVFQHLGPRATRVWSTVARAVVASEPWQRLVRERDEARAEAQTWLRHNNEARAAVARVEAALAEGLDGLHLLTGINNDEWINGWRRAVEQMTASINAALRGDAEEASDGR